MNGLYGWVLVYVRPVVEILLLAAVIYYFLLLFRGTRGAAVFTGFVIVLLVVGALTRLFHLDVINWILGRFLTFLAIAVLVIFQPELRRALAQVGSHPLLSSSQRRSELIDVLVETAHSLAQRHCGALIAVERDIGFRGIVETGVPLGARATVELLTTIFFPKTPLHDGGVVIRGDTILAAGCVFPLSSRPGLSATLGMRHRAAIGLSEETDAVVIVVSEETGEISVAHAGQLVRGLDPAALRAYLATMFAPGARPTHWLVRLVRRGLDALNLRELRTGAEPEASETVSSKSAGERS